MRTSYSWAIGMRQPAMTPTTCPPRSTAANYPFCQVDRRSDMRELERLAIGGHTPITTTEGETLARQLGALDHIECTVYDLPLSPLSRVKEVFDRAVMHCLDPREEMTCKRGCSSAPRPSVMRRVWARLRRLKRFVPFFTCWHHHRPRGAERLVSTDEAPSSAL